MANLPTYTDPQQQAFARRQAILDALKAQAIQPTQAPTAGQSGPFTVAARTNPLQGLAQMLQAYMANQGQQKLTNEQNAYQGDINQGFAQGLQQIQAAPDRKQALLAAMNSQNPLLRQYATQQATAGPDVVAFKPGDVLFDKTSNQFANPATQGGGQPFDIIPGPNGDLYQKTATGMSQLNKAPRTNVNVNASPIIKGQEAGYEKLFGEAVTSVKEYGSQAAASRDSLAMIERMKQLDAEGIFSNKTSGPVTWLNNVAQAFGVDVDEQKLGNTETFEAESSRAWTKIIAAQEGGQRGITKEEGEYIKKQLPQASSSPQARANIYKTLEKVAQRKMEDYDTAAAALKSAFQAKDPSIYWQSIHDIFLPQRSTTPSQTPAANPNNGGVIIEDWSE